MSTISYGNADTTWTGTTTGGGGGYTVLTATPRPPLTFRYVGTDAVNRRDRWRLTALVACGHAAFFLVLALAGRLR